MKSTGERIFLRVVSVVFVLGLFGASASAQMKRQARAALAASDFGLTKKHDGGKPRPGAAGGTSVPVAAQRGISAALGRDDSRYQVRAVGDGFRAQSPQQALTTEFTAQGIEVRSGAAQWGLALRGYGYGDALQAASPAAPQGTANRVEYRRGALTEWYVNGPLGMEQGFTLAERPGRSQGEPLTIALEVSKGLLASVDPSGNGLTLTRRDGPAKLRYAGLVAYDATGREMRSWLEARGGRLLLRVEDAAARYPLVIDPFIQIAKLTTSDATSGDAFGLTSIGISSDGGTLVVGAVNQTVGSQSKAGAAYVFEKPASGWATTSNFAAKLSASDGAFGGSLGSSLGISSDGGVVVAVGAKNGQGEAYVFVKPASGWASTTETARLTASDGAGGAGLGGRVGISSDGGTVLAGASEAIVGSNIGQGAAYLFLEPASGWATTTETAKLTASDGAMSDFFGLSVGVSGDGGTLVVGALGAIGSNSSQGAAYVFLKPAGGWVTTSNFTAKLAASDGAPNDLLGVKVGMSSDGGTVLAGAENATIGSNLGQGAAYVFVKPASGWATTMNFDAKLTASDGAGGDNFGDSLALSGDGGAVVVGVWQATVGANAQQGAVYVFLKPASGWATTLNFDAKLTASDGAAFDNLGLGVGVSSDGGTVFAGGAFGSNFQGGVYVFGPQGSGVPTASASTTSLSFGSQDVGTTSPSQSVTLTNTGSGALQVTGVAASSDFATTTNCVAVSPLQPNASCSESVTFTPPMAGSAAGTLTFTDNSGNIGGSQQTVSLSGTGVDFIASAAPVSHSVLPGHSVKYTITLTPLDGFTGTVTTKCAGGPAGTMCRLSASSVTLGSTATITATVTVPRNAKKRTWTLTFTAASGALVHRASVTLIVN